MRLKNGSALLVVLWVIAFLSFLAITSLMVTMQDVETTGARLRVARARQLAEMGVAIAAHPMIKMGDPLLKQQVNALESFEAVMSTEEALLNLNQWLTEQRRPVLERLFTTQGLRPIDAQTLVNRMMDWIDGDDLQRQDSWEKQQYARAGFSGRPYNRPFRNLDEVALVAGMDELTALWPEWRKSFTVWGDGRLDVNEAEPELIALVAEVPLEVARNFALQRNGPDGIRHTLDDTPVVKFEDAAALLGVNGEKAEELQKLITLQGGTRRIVSSGTVGDYRRAITVVLSRGSGRMNMLDWRESVHDGE